MKQLIFSSLCFLLSLGSVSIVSANELIPYTGSIGQHGPRIMTSSFEHQEAAVRIIIKGGALHEPESKRGIARLTIASVLNPVSVKKEGSNIYGLRARLQRLGAKVDVTVGTHATTIQLDAPSVSIKEAFALIVSNLTAPSLSESSILKTLERIREEQLIHEPLDNYYSLQRGLFPKLFANGREARTEIASSLTSKDVIQFYREKYEPKNMIFVGTGGISRESLERIVKSRLLLPMISEDVEKAPLLFTLTSTSPKLPLRGTEFGSVRQLNWGYKGIALFEDPAVCMVLGELFRRKVEEALEREMKMDFEVQGGYILLSDQGYFSVSIRGGGWKGVVGLVKQTATELFSKIRDSDIEEALSSLEKKRTLMKFHPSQLAEQFAQQVLAGRIDAADYESLENELETVTRSDVEARAKELFIDANSFVVKFDPVQK